MKKKEIYGYLIGILVPEVVGLFSQLFSGAGTDFYDTLNQPAFSPPGWVFPVVWTLLYALMGAASYRIYRSDSPCRTGALALYGAQLAVNFLWPMVFFRLEAIGAAVAVLVVLNILIFLTILQFAKIDRTAAWMMLPYLLWSLFALYLNLGVFALNG